MQSLQCFMENFLREATTMGKASTSLSFLIPVVFSDLDGTLLDHEDYSFSAAEPALLALHKRHVCLILASSKTRAEMTAIAGETGAGGLIFENGGGIVWPGGFAPVSSSGTPGPDYLCIRHFISSLPGELRKCLTGFGDMSVADVAAQTGLSLEQARLARQREFSEPFVWTCTPQELDEVAQKASDRGLRVIRGGRFNTLTGQQDKASRLLEMREGLSSACPPDQQIWTIALGDAPNDAAMLEAADRGFIIANPHGATIPELEGERDGRITRSTASGPSGWNESVMLALKEVDMINSRKPAHG
jgi:mannosyl-3-phosphoglycerate phosphatase